MPIQGNKEYKELKRKVLFDALEKYKGLPNRMVARILKRDNPELFVDVENARAYIRMYKGTSGEKRRNEVKNRKYYDVPMA